MCQVNQPNILDLHLTLWKSSEKNGLHPLFNDISLSECGQYMSQCSARIYFNLQKTKTIIMIMTRSGSNFRVAHVYRARANVS